MKLTVGICISFTTLKFIELKNLDCTWGFITVQLEFHRCLVSCASKSCWCKWQFAHKSLSEPRKTPPGSWDSGCVILAGFLDSITLPICMRFTSSECVSETRTKLTLDMAVWALRFEFWGLRFRSRWDGGLQMARAWFLCWWHHNNKN